MLEKPLRPKHNFHRVAMVGYGLSWCKRAVLAKGVKKRGFVLVPVGLLFEFSFQPLVLVYLPPRARMYGPSP
jgi:hypothetical protein